MEEIEISGKKMSFSDRMRIWFKWFLDPIGGFFNGLGLMPNTLTLLGLTGNTAGAVLIAQGNMLWGGLLVLLMGPVDALDGTMARLRGEPSDFGGFVDSVTDRYSELVIYGGLLFYFVNRGDALYSILVFAAAAGSILVSYVKARAEALGFNAKVGILTRMERYLVLVPALVFNLPQIGLWIIATFANITALQRILHVRMQAHTQLFKS